MEKRREVASDKEKTFTVKDTKQERPSLGGEL